MEERGADVLMMQRWKHERKPIPGLETRCPGQVVFEADSRNNEISIVKGY